MRISDWSSDVCSSDLHIIDGDALPYAPDKLARKPTCGVDGFLGVDLRVGTIIDAAPFAGARKPAYRLRVDFGPVVGVLETSAQITHYRIETLIGRRVVGALKDRKSTRLNSSH